MMKTSHDNDDEYIDPNELQYQQYEQMIRNTSLYEFMQDKNTHRYIQEHYVNFCLDEIEPLIEKEINLWKHEYEMDDLINEAELLFTVMHHIDYNKPCTKEYIENNPECVQQFVAKKIKKEYDPSKETTHTFKTYVTPNLNKKFVWKTRKYVE